MTRINRLFPFVLSIILALAFSVATVAQQPAQATPKPETAKESKKDGSEAHLCGAPTKAGGKCKRRVKAAGYCWMHKGK